MFESNVIRQLNSELETNYSDYLLQDNNLSRKIVSFQADKKVANYRWYKYKEAFSSSLVEYFIKSYDLVGKNILDPFAGIGTTLFTASSLGCESTGIELLPVGQKIIEAKINAHFGYLDGFIPYLTELIEKKTWNEYEPIELNELRITKGAYPQGAKDKIGRFLSLINLQNNPVKTILELALFSILEEVSFTRKDGQYLRWDYRANRSWGKKPFNKGPIKDFDTAMSQKLKEIIVDLNGGENLSLFDFYHTDNNSRLGNINLIKGSCLKKLLEIKNNTFHAVITSPPYCNRYDYTRTYALELALLNITEKELVDLRQTMLSSTVENREKDLLSYNSAWKKPLKIAQQMELLNKIITHLEDNKKMLNNTGIIRMIKGYFYELSCIIYELYRILKQSGYFFMVNDNVRYAGISIPVDLILSDIAKKIGFDILKILVLPQKKGNSSQQMGQHGRLELRKCVYIWKKV